MPKPFFLLSTLISTPFSSAELIGEKRPALSRRRQSALLDARLSHHAIAGNPGSREGHSQSGDGASRRVGWTLHARFCRANTGPTQNARCSTQRQAWGIDDVGAMHLLFGHSDCVPVAHGRGLLENFISLFPPSSLLNLLRAYTCGPLQHSATASNQSP